VQAGIAPKFYGRFINGRIEEFYNNSRPISWSEMGATEKQLQNPDVWHCFAWGIATEMAKLHSITVKEGICKTNSSDPPQILQQIEDWGNIAKGVNLTSYNNNITNPSHEIDVGKLLSDWKWMRDDILFPVESRRKTVGQKFAHDNVFTHLDCQSLNIMTSESWGENEVRLIDFEYAGYNPRALDIANTWLEHCDMNNLSPDYEKEFPSITQQKFYLWRYCKASKGFDLKLLNTSHFLEDFRKECMKFTLLSHLTWALWSVIQHKSSEIKFDFLEYAKIRLVGYQHHKMGLTYDEII